jgi:DNA repair exonuclease SbcCD ATPase subunit
MIDLASRHDAELAEQKRLEEQRIALNERAAAIEKAHNEDTARMTARRALEKEQASEQLQARLQKKRRKKLKSLNHDAHARQKLHDDEKTMKKVREHKDKLANLEDEVAKISAQFASHVEAQTKAMEDEKIRQHKNVAARRRRANARRNKKKKDIALQPDSAASGSAVNLATEAKLRTMCVEVNQSRDKARQRLALGQSWEDQYRSLVAAIKQVVAHNSALVNSGPSRISAPNVAVGRTRLTLGMPGMDKARKRENLLRKLDELDGRETKNSVRPPLPP